MKRLMAVLLTLVFAAPAMAMESEWDLYGSARVSMFWVNKDKDANDGINDDTDLDNGLMSTARIGARVKATEQVSGRFEYGASDGNASIRLLYGVFDFGAGSLLVGQDWDAAGAGISNQVVLNETNLLEGGDYTIGRDPQIRLSFGNFSLALIKNQGDPAGVGGAADAGYTESEITLPMVEAVYTFSTDKVMIKPHASYQTFDVKTTGTGQSSESVTSYALGVGAKVQLGPASIGASAYYGQNLYNHGVWFRANASAAKAQLVNGSINDATGYGAAFVFMMPFTEAIGFEAGVGYTSNEVDTAPGVTIEDDGMTYYVQLPITLAEGVTIVPEISVFDDGTTSVTGAADIEEGTTTCIGAKFQINF